MCFWGPDGQTFIGESNRAKSRPSGRMEHLACFIPAMLALGTTTGIKNANFVCSCMYAFMHICVHAYNVCIHAYMCSCVCIYACMYSCVYVFVHVCIYACMCVCMYVCMVKYYGYERGIKESIFEHVHVCVHVWMYAC
jgi:hypothetical protein